jgi:Zn-dependent peptidase ImmA (M78 family)/DNA-binding XRE family transcriptional regulator
VRPGTPGFVPARLREAREARSMTLVGLSELIDVSKQAVSKYELGEMTPGPDTLFRIAAVLRVPPEFFTLAERDESDEVIFYRSLAAATKGARIRGARRIEWLADIAAFLMEYVEFPPLAIPALDLGPEDAAVAVRAGWGLDDGPLGNLAWMLETRGAILTRGYIDARTIDAFSKWHPMGRPLIYLAADKGSAVRSRFDAAHELGHMVLHRSVQRREFQRGPDFKRIEGEANDFASAFLLPSSSFMADLWSPGLDNMRLIKQKWGASIAAMIFRSKQLGIITDSYAEKLRISAARRGWTRLEPLDDVLPVEEPRLLRRSVELLVDQGILPRDAVARALRLGALDVEVLANLPTGYLSESEAPVRLLDRAVPSRSDDGSRGSVVSFRRSDDPSEQERPS